MKHLITNLAIKFIEERWHEIIKDLIASYTKESLLNDIKNDYQTASWVVSEVMMWGTSTDYHKQYSVEYDQKENDRGVIKIEDTYFMMSDDYEYIKVEPKFKTVMYFE